MRFLISALFILATSACGKVENSSSQDKALYSPRPTGSPQFLAAQAIIVQKCSECHGSWAGFTEVDYVQSGLLVPQNAAASKIYYRNQLATSGPGPKSMPSQGRPAMTATEVQAIEDWVTAATP
jgi:uncharacterized membrane protein